MALRMDTKALVIVALANGHKHGDEQPDEGEDERKVHGKEPTHRCIRILS